MQEKWAHRAELAEAAVNDRHARKVWGIPRTNLAVVSWPSTSKDQLFVHWHYWWQAHYIDCLVDAAERTPTKVRQQRIADTVRGVRVRNFRGWTHNRYYDDKSWLALSIRRATKIPKSRLKSRTNKGLSTLEENILEGLDSLTGVLPWRTNETFYNVPTNGPAAIMMARTGRLETAVQVVDWVFDNLIDERGLVMDGMRMRMHGPEMVSAIHPYCQGVMMGACLEIAEQMLQDGGLIDQPAIESLNDADKASDAFRYVAKVRDLVRVVSTEMCTRTGVINWATSGGDGGLFKGILARYLADVALRLPGDSPATLETKKLAAKLVLSSAESLWNHRLEVDGLPVFSSDWTADAVLPENTGIAPSSGTIAGAVMGSTVHERDLSVQLSGWMLLEAAARIAAAQSKPKKAVSAK